MKNKEPSRIFRNWGLKLVSLIVAIVLWLIVVNINDPNQKVTFSDVPVTIQNTEAITNQGMIYEVLDGTDVISKVTLYAPRSIASSIEKSDVIATADMNNLSSLNTIAIDLSLSKYNAQISSMRSSIETVKVNIENKKTVQLVLNTNVSGAAPTGYIIGNVTTDQNLIRVTGPESVVNRIDHASINIDMSTLSEFTSDISTNAVVRLLDEEENEVEGSTLSSKPESVNVKIEILSTKEVPLAFRTSGEPAEGYALTGEITPDKDTITIAGKKATLSSISEIIIPEDAIVVSEATENVTAHINVKNYLPDGVSLVNAVNSGFVSVVVGVEKEDTKEFTVDAEDIQIIGAPDDMNASISSVDEKTQISVTGIKSVISKVTDRNVSVSFDYSAWAQEQEDIKPGKYHVILTVTTPDKTRVTEELTAVLTLEEKEE